MTAAEAAVKNSTMAARWIGSAQNSLHNVLPYLTKASPADVPKLIENVDFMEDFVYLDNQFHFKLVDRNFLISSITRLNVLFFNMHKFCLALDDIARDAEKHPDGSVPVAWSYPLHSDDGPEFDGHIYFSPKYLKLGPRKQIYIVVHELAHFVDEPPNDFQSGNIQGITDIAYEAYDQAEYDKLSPEKAMKNADTYAMFALQAHHNLYMHLQDNQ
jgi:hypothetical protein